MKALAVLFPALLMSQAPDLSIRQDPPPAVPSAQVTAIYSGPAGGTTYYYWIVARYPIGYAVPPTPATVQRAAGLGAGNSVALRWPTMPRATGYDVLRTTAPAAPAACVACAVALNIQINSVTDTGSATAWPPAGVPAAGSATAVIQLDNISAAAPFVTLAVRNAQRLLTYQLGLLRNQTKPEYVPPESIQLYSANNQLACVDSAGSNCMPSAGADVIAFGARCDGTTDDAAAFQRAIDATTAGTVSVPGGKVCGISSVTMRPYVTLDLGGSTLQKVGTSTAAVIQMPATGSFSHNVIIRNGIIRGVPGIAHNGIDLRAQVATTSAIQNVHVTACGNIGIYLAGANVLSLTDVWSIANVAKNVMVESSNDVYMFNITVETGNPAVTTTANIEIRNAQNITITNMHAELFNALPAITLDGATHYAIENLYGYYFGSRTVPAFIDATTSRGVIRYAQAYTYDGTVTLTNLIRDSNGVSWNSTYPGYAVTRTGFNGLGNVETYSRQADRSLQWGNILLNTPSPAADLPASYWAMWMPHGTSLFADDNSAEASAYLTSNIRRRADDAGFTLLDSAKSGWIARMGQGPEYFQIVRSPSGAYAPFTLFQVERTANGFRTFQQAAAAQTANIHEWRDSNGVPRVVIANEFGLYTQGRYPQVAGANGNYVVSATDEIVTCNATAATATITLPSAALQPRRQITIKRIDASGNTCEVTAAAGNVDGSASYSLNAYRKYITVFSDGANWWAIANN